MTPADPLSLVTAISFLMQRAGVTKVTIDPGEARLIEGTTLFTQVFDDGGICLELDNTNAENN